MPKQDDLKKTKFSQFLGLKDVSSDEFSVSNEAIASENYTSLKSVSTPTT